MGICHCFALYQSRLYIQNLCSHSSSGLNSAHEYLYVVCVKCDKMTIAWSKPANRVPEGNGFLALPLGPPMSNWLMQWGDPQLPVSFCCMNLSLLIRREARQGFAGLCCVCQHTASPAQIEQRNQVQRPFSTSLSL